MTAEKLEELLKKATQGPWKVRDGFMIDELHIAPVKVNGKRKPEIGKWAEIAEVPTHYVRRGDGKANATLIALAPSLARRVIAAEKLAEAVEYDLSCWPDTMASSLRQALTAYRKARGM